MNRTNHFDVGAWKVQVDVRLDLRFWTLGIEAAFFSWANAYPWWKFAAGFGPLYVTLDLTRPDSAALELRREMRTWSKGV